MARVPLKDIESGKRSTERQVTPSVLAGDDGDRRQEHGDADAALVQVEPDDLRSPREVRVIEIRLTERQPRERAVIATERVPLDGWAIARL